MLKKIDSALGGLKIDYGQQKKYFNLLMILPKISAIVFMVIMFIWAIVDTAVFQYDGYYGYHCGIMMMPNGFLNWFVWMLIGGVSSFLIYFVGKIALSYKAIVVLNLEKIAEIAGKENDTAEQDTAPKAESVSTQTFDASNGNVSE
mgnify:CR=1 FL=1